MVSKLFAPTVRPRFKKESSGHIFLSLSLSLSFSVNGKFYFYFNSNRKFELLSFQHLSLKPMTMIKYLMSVLK